jgi:hypothetical protein
MKRDRKNFLSFEEARAKVRKFGFKDMREFNRKKYNSDFYDIPYTPDKYYKEWINWYDWLGTGFISFEEARDFARSLKFNMCSDWKKYCRSGQKPRNIPSIPSYYKDFVDWYDWLGTNREKRKYKVNDDYFKKWSHDMAYVLGFWFSDGNIYIKPKGKKGGQYIFSISQNTKDRYILENISQKMKSNFPIYDGVTGGGSIYSKLSIRSKQIIEDIIKLGGKERKSLDVKFPKIPKKYLPDFMRGLWDGDGTVYYGKSKDNKMKGGASITLGSSEFIERLKEVLEFNIKNIKVCIYTRRVFKGDKIFNKTRTNSNTYYTLSMSTNGARRLRDFMYLKNDELRLTRKYLKFKSLGEILISTAEREYLSYDEASQYIKQFGIKTIKEWFIFSKGGKRPLNIPSDPGKMYKNKGFTNMADFLGNWPKTRMLPFEDARKYAMTLGIRTYQEWTQWAGTSKRPKNIPSCPDSTYQNKGYQGIRHWLGLN